MLNPLFRAQDRSGALPSRQPEYQESNKPVNLPSRSAERALKHSDPLWKQAAEQTNAAALSLRTRGGTEHFYCDGNNGVLQAEEWLMSIIRQKTLNEIYFI